MEQNADDSMTESLAHKQMMEQNAKHSMTESLAQRQIIKQNSNDPVRKRQQFRLKNKI